MIWPEAFESQCANDTGCMMKAAIVSNEEINQVEDKMDENAEDIGEFVEGISGHLNQIAMEAVMNREQAIRNVTASFGQQLDVIAKDMACNPQCVDGCASRWSFDSKLQCLSSCVCDSPITFSVTETFSVKPKAEIGLVQCSVNAQNKVFCAGPNPLILAEEPSANASFKFDTYTITLICVFAA